jgi:hypothetical protein
MARLRQNVVGLRLGIRDARAGGEVMQHIRGLFKHESFEKKQVSIRDVLKLSAAQAARCSFS